MPSLKNPPLSENRQNPRVNWMDPEVHVVVNARNDESKISGWIQDISQGGFKLKADGSWTLHDVLREWSEISFETSDDFFKLRGHGTIIWVSRGGNMAGIRIDHLDEEGRRYLSGFLGVLPAG